MISDALAYAIARLEALGYQEWPDALGTDNIPKPLHDRAFHVELGDASRVSTHQDNMHIDVPMTVRLYIQQRRNTKASRVSAVSLADTVIASCVLASNRLNSTAGMKDIRFENMSLAPYGATNDNALVVTLDFTALVVMSLR
jgi:hypothetical protein